MRSYQLSHMYNVRDLGGYGCPGGETVFGKLIRSAVPEHLTPEDIALFQKVGLTDVIDLRADLELRQAPNAFCGVEGVTVHSIPFLSDAADIPQTDEAVPASYLAIARHPNMAKVMRVFLNAKGATLFHCSAGKDRTGTTAALLLLLAGVGEDDIIADYCLSQVYMRKQLDRFARECPQFPLCLIYPRMENILGFLELFRRAYPNAESYFVELGMAEAEIKELREKIIVKTY